VRWLLSHGAALDSRPYYSVEAQATADTTATTGGGDPRNGGDHALSGTHSLPSLAGSADTALHADLTW